MTERPDELVLQRLVDGALDESQRSDFLATAEDHPQWWREVALAFVEETILSDVLETDDSTSPLGSEPDQVSPSKPNRSASNSPWLQQLILVAASLLVVLL